MSFILIFNPHKYDNHMACSGVKIKYGRIHMPPSLLESTVGKSPLRLQHHYIYIVSWTFLASAIIYLIGGIDYIDALLLASGSATQSGLNSIDLNRLHVLQQVTLLAVSMITNVIFVNTLLVCIRLYWFRKRFQGVIHAAKAISWMRKWKGDHHLPESSEDHRLLESRSSIDSISEDAPEREDWEQPLLGRVDGYDIIKQIATRPSGSHVTFHEGEREAKHHQRSYSVSRSIQSLSESRTSYQHLSHDLESVMPGLPMLMWQPSIASYSDWDEAQKDQLGGIEYRALKTLLVILVCYIVVIHLIGMLLLVPWIWLNPRYGQILENGIGKFWWATFTTSSAFYDMGYTLTPDSMVSFNTTAFPLLVMTFLVVIGNTGFPCMLRLIIWVLSKTTNHGTPLDEELQFLLEHPRRCFTLLFPGAETWRLFGVLLLLNGFDMAIFCTLDKLENAPNNGNQLPSTGLWLANGLFQVASTRTAGFTITSLADIHPGVQVSFIIMMYVSAFPTAIAMRKTNVYEERSLGIYDDDPGSEEDPKTDSQQGLAVHIQRLLGFDLWYVMLGFFLVAVSEGRRLQQTEDDPAFSLFSALFEIVSAYGTVGLSLGYPETQTSFCAQFNWFSKLIIIAMQVRGRHRGLPHALDHAILLPCELHQEDQEGDGDVGWLRRWLKKQGPNISNLFSQVDTENGGEERLFP